MLSYSEQFNTVRIYIFFNRPATKQVALKAVKERSQKSLAAKKLRVGGKLLINLRLAEKTAAVRPVSKCFSFHSRRFIDFDPVVSTDDLSCCGASRCYGEVAA